MAGFEPATTRVISEVTLVFTTGRIVWLRTRPRLRRIGFRLTVDYLQIFAGEGARATSVFYGQGTGGHGRACALRLRTSQPAEAELSAREVSVANHHWP